MLDLFLPSGELEIAASRRELPIHLIGDVARQRVDRVFLFRRPGERLERIEVSDVVVERGDRRCHRRSPRGQSVSDTAIIIAHKQLFVD